MQDNSVNKSLPSLKQKAFLFCLMSILAIFLFLIFYLAISKINSSIIKKNAYQFSYSYILHGASVFTEVKDGNCVYFDAKKHTISQVKEAYIKNLALKGINPDIINVDLGCDLHEWPVINFKNDKFQ